MPLQAAVATTSDTRSFDDTPERLLLRHLQGLVDCSSEFFAVHVLFSHLSGPNVPSGTRAAAARPLYRVADCHDVTVFALANLDLVLLCRETPVEIIERALTEAARLAPTPSYGRALADEKLASWYDLSSPEAFQRLIDLIGRMDCRYSGSAQASGMRPKTLVRPIECHDLVALRSQLRAVTFDDLIRHQTALTVKPGEAPLVIFQEAYVSIPELRARIRCEIDLVGTTWLFQGLTDILDAGVVTALGAKQRGHSAPVSLNLSVRSIQTQVVRTFLQRMAGLGQRVYCELAFPDVLSDAREFERASDWVRGLGHGVIIDGVSPHALTLLNLGCLGPDFIKVLWSDDNAGTGARVPLEAVRAAVAGHGPETIVLARAETEQAVGWGSALGITRFQGFFIDRVVAAMRIKDLI